MNTTDIAMLAWGIGWPVLGFLVFWARRPKQSTGGYPKLRELIPTRTVPAAINVTEYYTHGGVRSIRCAPTSKLPRAWTVRR